MQYFTYNMTASSVKALSVFLRQLAANSALEKACLAAAVHGQLGLSLRTLAAPAAVLPQPDVSHGDTTPARAALGQLVEAAAAAARGAERGSDRTADAKGLLDFISRTWRGRGVSVRVREILFSFYED